MEHGAIKMFGNQGCFKSIFFRLLRPLPGHPAHNAPQHHHKARDHSRKNKISHAFRFHAHIFGNEIDWAQHVRWAMVTCRVSIWFFLANIKKNKGFSVSFYHWDDANGIFFFFFLPPFCTPHESNRAPLDPFRIEREIFGPNSRGSTA